MYGFRPPTPSKATSIAILGNKSTIKSKTNTKNEGPPLVELTIDPITSVEDIGQALFSHLEQNFQHLMREKEQQYMTS